MDALILNAARAACESPAVRGHVRDVLRGIGQKDFCLNMIADCIEEWTCSQTDVADRICESLRNIHTAVSQDAVSPEEAYRITGLSPLELIAEACREPTVRKQMLRILTYEVGPPTTEQLRSTLAWHAKFWGTAEGPNHRSLSEVCLIALVHVNDTECGSEVLYSAANLYS